MSPARELNQGLGKGFIKELGQELIQELDKDMILELGEEGLNQELVH